MLDAGHPIVLGLSGGGDSMALLELAAAWARTRGRRLLAVTVDHALNPSSLDWGRTCARACASLGVEWLETRWIGDKPAAGLTAAARMARHGLIADVARKAGAKVILLAHTADDIAESDWMRARGSNLGHLREWSPSPVWPEGRGLMLFRPLLEESREKLRNFLRARGRGWIEDPANADTRFGRSRARLSLLPEGEGGPVEPGRMRGSSVEILEPASDAVTPHPPTASGVVPLPFPLGEGFKVERSAPSEFLGAVLLCASGSSSPPRNDHLVRLSERLRSVETFTATLAGARIEASNERILIGREPGEYRRSPSADHRLTPGAPTVWDSRYEITTFEPGWTVTAAAGRLSQLSDADRTIIASVPAWARGALPVLLRDCVAGPVLAWRKAEVRALAPRRLALFLGAMSGETTQEADLFRSIHGETPPADLFSYKDHHSGLG